MNKIFAKTSLKIGFRKEQFGFFLLGFETIDEASEFMDKNKIEIIRKIFPLIDIDATVDKVEYMDEDENIRNSNYLVDSRLIIKISDCGNIKYMIINDRKSMMYDLRHKEVQQIYIYESSSDMQKFRKEMSDEISTILTRDIGWLIKSDNNIFMNINQLSLLNTIKNFPTLTDAVLIFKDPSISKMLEVIRNIDIDINLHVYIINTITNEIYKVKIDDNIFISKVNNKIEYL